MAANSKMEAEADVGVLGVVIGAAKDWRVTLKSRATGAALPLTAADKLVLTVRKSPGGPILFTQKNTAAGGSDAEIAIVDGPNGVIDFSLVEANAALLTPPGEWAFALRYELASDGKDRAGFKGRFCSEQDAGAAIP